VELWIEPGELLPNGCLVVQWLDGAVPAGDILEREGKNAHTLLLCEKLGQALQQLHSAEVQGVIPDFIGRADRANALWYGQSKARILREVGLVNEAFERKFVALVEKYVGRIPDPHPPTLCFQDMHFSNILVATDSEPEVAAFIDVSETVVGCPLWDFTNWERWELLYHHPWVREPVLEAYGEIDMELYRFAVLVRFAESHDLFQGAIKEQISRAVEAGEAMAFDLDQLRCE
jgi:aminoglycoside phosphotransferase (APT) family kinase protein